MSTIDVETEHAVWSKVEDGFYAGSRLGEFIGYIEREADGSYIASNGYSRRIGAFSSLSSAMRAIDGGTGNTNTVEG